MHPADLEPEGRSTVPQFPIHRRARAALRRIRRICRIYRIWRILAAARLRPELLSPPLHIAPEPLGPTVALGTTHRLTNHCGRGPAPVRTLGDQLDAWQPAVHGPYEHPVAGSRPTRIPKPKRAENHSARRGRHARELRPFEQVCRKLKDLLQPDVHEGSDSDDLPSADPEWTTVLDDRPGEVMRDYLEAHTVPDLELLRSNRRRLSWARHVYHPTTAAAP